MSAKQEIRRLVDQAAELVDAITDQAARDEANYLRGWQDAARVFFNHGVDVGYRAAEAAEERKWSGYIQPALRAAANRPTVAEYKRGLAGPRPGDYTGAHRAGR